MSSSSIELCTHARTLPLEQKAHATRGEIARCAWTIGPAVSTALLTVATLAAGIALLVTNASGGLAGGLAIGLAVPLCLAAVAVALQTKNYIGAVLSAALLVAFIVVGPLTIAGLMHPTHVSQMMLGASVGYILGTALGCAEALTRKC